MAVQAQHVSRDFHHDLHSYWALEDRATGGYLFLDERGGCATVMAGISNTLPSDIPRSDLTCNDNNYNSAFVPRKRARVAPTPAQGFVPVGGMPCRAVGSGVASTSGVIGNASGLSQVLLSQLCNHEMEIYVLVRVETERTRAVLGEAWRRHVRALAAAAAGCGGRAGARALPERGGGEEAAPDGAEGQAWIGVAQSHEAVAAGLRATLGQLLQSPYAARACVTEDARLCCFETPACDNAGSDEAGQSSYASCRACGQGGACVLILPCRHLCPCHVCDATVDACPVCAATKNASLQVSSALAHLDDDEEKLVGVVWSSRTSSSYGGRQIIEELHREFIYLLRLRDICGFLDPFVNFPFATNNFEPSYGGVAAASHH